MEYKLSQYHIITDPVNNSTRQRIAFATRTAKAFVINESLYSKLENQAWNEISEPTFEKLRKAELIVPLENDELKTVISRNKAAIREIDELYYVIQPTAMCQLGCGYCGQKHTKNYLNKNTNEKIIERLEKKLKSKAYKSLYIAWFGSEPLLGLSQIRTLTPKLITLANKYNCSYNAKVVTNGLSLKEPIFLELVNKHKINSIEVTLDGTAKFHNARRHTKAGLSTFDLIFNNLLKIYNLTDFKNLPCSLSIRCNVDARNHEGVVPLIRLLAEHNLQDKISHFYIAPIHSWGNDAHLLSLSYEEFADMQIDWLLELYKYGFNPGLLPGLKSIVCMSVNPEAEVIDAFGNVYDCTEVPYVPTYEGSEHNLGNISKGSNSISKKRPLLHFNDEVLENSFPCSSCEMLPVCGGACPKSWRENIPPCPTSKYNIKDKLLLHYAIKKDKEKVLS